MTAEPNDYEIWNNISTHILTRRMTISSFKVLSSFIFQLTSSQGGWRILAAPWMAVNYFNSHPHKEDDVFSYTPQGAISNFNSHPHKEDDVKFFTRTKQRRKYFNSHPHKEDDVRFGLFSMITLYFNSHPHKEDDGNYSRWNSSTCISTHILTRRMTVVHCRHCNDWSISTHILTRRMTRCYLKLSNGYIISTHILTRRMTKIKYLKQRSQVFQLTSSQGGWPPCIQCDTYQKYFNSHPHKEDDLSGCSLDSKQSNFNSHPHKEDDDEQEKNKALTEAFQLTSSQGGWRIWTGEWTSAMVFQLTSSQGGWRVDEWTGVR